RKIVPPTTTSKARKKVAGSTRKPDGSAASPDAHLATDATAAIPDTAAAGNTETEAFTALPSSDETPESVSLTKTDTATADTATAADADPAADNGLTPDTASGASRSRLGWMPVVVVGAVALLLIAFATVAALKPGGSNDNQAWVDQGASSEVTRAATEGLTALYRYNYETIDDDLAKARDYMGPELQEQTNQFLDAIKSGAQQTQTATEVDIMDIGLTRLEDQKAELLANMNVSSTRAGVAYDSAMFPIVVNMENIDGRWVVSATELK
ncbi:MAG: hypothetical protein WBQ44_06080, partial [Rhodococcus sp. (in: high G+C Gram-positive bacteria)]